MKDHSPRHLGRFPDEAIRRAPQRCDWTPEQLQTLGRLDQALAGAPLDEKTAYWRRKWVEWFLRWVFPDGKKGVRTESHCCGELGVSRDPVDAR